MELFHVTVCKDFSLTHTKLQGYSIYEKKKAGILNPVISRKLHIKLYDKANSQE